MQIYDISQEVFSSVVYAGDTAPAKREVRRTARGDLYNLTDFSMCAHNGTHIDAPFHFLADGRTVEEIPLEKTIGRCYVTSFDGEMCEEDARKILDEAKKADAEAARRILLKGDAIVTPEAAEVFAGDVFLIGVESQSVGDAEAPMAVHLILLRREVVLLEGLRLGGVRDGVYFLSAAPLALGGADGAPCRAVLIEL